MCGGKIGKLQWRSPTQNIKVLDLDIEVIDHSVSPQCESIFANLFYGQVTLLQHTRVSKGKVGSLTMKMRKLENQSVFQKGQPTDIQRATPHFFAGSMQSQYMHLTYY